MDFLDLTLEPLDPPMELSQRLLQVAAVVVDALLEVVLVLEVAAQSGTASSDVILEVPQG